MSDQLERNKQTVIDFYDLAFNQCKPAEAVQRYVGDVYIQHNTRVADGTQGFIAYFEPHGQGVPGETRALQAPDRRGATVS